MLKKIRLKQEKKALDELEKNDPEGYTEKLRQLERDRIQVDMLHIEGCWYFAEWNGMEPVLGFTAGTKQNIV